ncbi:RNA pyrophosphohydrolase [Blastomonas aquatica]|uniref:RNA pyrophosphohydrolase n=1 Tax=Blastomonas aquatica TaxID=1510276 RepID=A0ABQ1J495_9SPHN|nr:RNA pyrophosphohydrolase [Blastomonas aquatica]GGB59704.1 RNA pyrophosphohydrolase [Blastomonas aquatica]
MSDFDNLPYRPCAGIMLVNNDGKVFVGQRLDSSADAWQMPQGGIDPGEEPEQAAYRELGEETGIAPHLVEVIARSREEHMYDLPADLMGKMWGGKYRGQRQFWFLMRFMGTDADINIETDHQEFRTWRWTSAETLEGLIVPFKRRLYRAVVEEFRPLI